MKNRTRTIILIIVGALLLMVALHFAFNTDWMALIKSIHNPPKH